MLTHTLYKITFAFVFLSATVTNFYVNSQSSIANQDEANERANAGALKAIGNMPRYGGDTTMDKEDLNGDDMTYLYGILSLVAVPLFFVGFTLLIAPLWAMCRCCHCCCCKKTEPKHDITSCQIYSPLLLVLGCMIAVIAMAAIGYGANVDFSGALLYNDGTGEKDNLLSVAETLVSDASSKMNLIVDITLDLKEGTESAIEKVQDILNDTSILSVGMSSLIATLDNISSTWWNYTVTSEWNGTQYDFSCEFCSTFGAEVAGITEEIENQTAPVFVQLNDTVTGIENSLVEDSSLILDSLDSFISIISNVRDDVEGIEDLVVNVRDLVETHNGHRELTYNIIFAIPLISVIYLLFGGVLKKPVCFTFAYCYLWFSCTLMWALLAVHLPLAVLLYDSCEFLDVVDQNVSSTINGTVGEVLQSCLTGEPLAETLGLASYLNFTEVITFPSLGNISDNFQFDQLAEFEDDAFSTNFTTFYAEGDAALMVINNLTTNSLFASDNLTSLVWTRENIASLHSSWYYPLNVTNVTDESTTAKQTLDELQDLLMAENVSINAFVDTVSLIQDDMNDVVNESACLEHRVQEMVNNVENASVLLNPVFDSVHEMEEAAECGFVGNGYHDTKAVMCHAVLGSLSRIVVAMIVIAVLTMAGCMWTIGLVRKVDHWQEQKKQEKDEKLQQSMQPNKPKIILMQQPSGYQPGYGNGYNGPAI